MSDQKHPFARFIAIIGRGKRLSRTLTRSEAAEAFGLILDRKALPEQIGAFLMLLRLREETGEEIAGFVDAVRVRLPKPLTIPALDWPSYAGKARLNPWYVLAALALAQFGRKILMHGASGHTPGRCYTTDVLAALNIPIAQTTDDAATMLNSQNFAYLPLEAIHPVLAELMNLRATLGLRSPVHTLVRAINPFCSPVSILGVFHPGYIDIHRQAEELLASERTLLFRGDGGEAERRIAKSCELTLIAGGHSVEDRWPAITRMAPADGIDICDLVAVWQRKGENEGGEAVVIATIALALKAMYEAHDHTTAHDMAKQIWDSRA